MGACVPCAPPLTQNFFHFHAVFRKSWPNNRLAPPFRVSAPFSGKSWIRHWYGLRQKSSPGICCVQILLKCWCSLKKFRDRNSFQTWRIQIETFVTYFRSDDTAGDDGDGDQIRPPGPQPSPLHYLLRIPALHGRRVPELTRQGVSTWRHSVPS